MILQVFNFTLFLWMFLLISSAEKHRDPVRDTKSLCGIMQSSNYRPPLIMVQKREWEEKKLSQNVYGEFEAQTGVSSQVIVLQLSVETQRLPVI